MQWEQLPVESDLYYDQMSSVGCMMLPTVEFLIIHTISKLAVQTD